MSYRFTRDASVRDDVVRIAQEQTREAIDEIDDDDLSPHEAIHQARKRCKKIRALLRTVRGVAPELYDRENAHFRDAARRVAALRDATTVIEAYDLVADAFDDGVDLGAFVPIREALLDRRDELADELDLDARVEALRRDLEEGHERAGTWELDVDGFDALEDGLAETYGRARDRLTDAYDERTSEAFHEWRKRVKYHRYHVRLLQDAWPELLGPRREELHELSDLLGDDHDLAVLRRILFTELETFPQDETLTAFVGLLDRERARLQREAEPLGTKLFADEAEALVSRLRTIWGAWYEQAGAAAAPRAPVVTPGR